MVGHLPGAGLTPTEAPVRAPQKVTGSIKRAYAAATPKKSCRQRTLELMRKGPEPVPGILVSCQCPIRWRVSESNVNRACFVCHGRRRVVS